MSHTYDHLDARARTIGSDETAERLGVERSTLDNWRWRGGGPQYLKVGGRVRYRLADLADWLDAQARSSTSDGRSAAKAHSNKKEE